MFKQSFAAILDPLVQIFHAPQFKNPEGFMLNFSVILSCTCHAILFSTYFKTIDFSG